MTKKKILLIIPVVLMILLVMLMITALKKCTGNSSGKPEVIENVQADYTKLQTEGGRYRYEDEHFKSCFGIDVSTFQGDIDWKKVKEDGVDFVFIRIGRRGATTGLIYEDDEFDKNYQGASENGIRIGVYFFSQAISEKEAREEAEWVVKQLKGKQIDLPVVYDLEEVYLEDETPRTEGISPETATKNALAFLETIEKNRYSGMLYTSLYWSDYYYDMERFGGYPIWFAQYENDVPELDLPISIWQYSSQGVIDGIDEKTDLNIMFIRKD